MSDCDYPFGIFKFFYQKLSCGIKGAGKKDNVLRILQRFPKSISSTSVSTVISCTRVSTRSDHLMTGTAVHKAHHSTLHASCCADIENDMYIEELDNNDDEITA